ncbi:hypothetical protein [Ascidiimonas aurantiaca]|uniref:FUSC family protein n=1 Tax=Ascidiimonas aurantiaca TaxID=1685432 RepID=UPI0030EC4F33
MDTIKALLEQLILHTEDATRKENYQKLLSLLSEIETKNLSEQKKEALHNQLENIQIQLQRGVSKKEYSKMIEYFKHFLIHELMLIPKGHYRALGNGLGVALGSGLGLTFGVLVHTPWGLVYGMLLGSILGLLAGLFIGKTQDLKAEKEQRVLIYL